jgi:hypothetical protein
VCRIPTKTSFPSPDGRSGTPVHITPPVPPLPRVAVPSSHHSSPLVLVFRPSATSPTGCQHRTPELLPPPQFLRKLALSLPLFGSIAPVASPCFICPESLLAQLVPSSFHLRRPTHFSGELRVTVGRHIQATTARTEPSGSFPSTHRCFPAPGRPSIPAEKLLDQRRPPPPSAHRGPAISVTFAPLGPYSRLLCAPVKLPDLIPTTSEHWTFAPAFHLHRRPPASAELPLPVALSSIPSVLRCVKGR